MIFPPWSFTHLLLVVFLPLHVVPAAGGDLLLLLLLLLLHLLATTLTSIFTWSHTILIPVTLWLIISEFNWDQHRFITICTNNSIGCVQHYRKPKYKTFWHWHLISCYLRYWNSRLLIWVNCYCWGNSSMVEGLFQSGFRVLKTVFWTFSYLNLWHTMWFHAKKLLKTLKFWKSLNSLCKSGSRPQKSPKKAQKTDHSIAIYSNF